jgi:HNH endonuclease
MGFSAETIRLAHARAKDRCECERPGHWHSPGRCRLPLWDDGPRYARHRVPPDRGGDDSLANCEAICVLCHLRRLREE